MIVDSHCHASKGDAMTAPWNIDAPLGACLRRSRAADIARTAVFSRISPRLRLGEQKVLINAEVYRRIGLRTLARIRPFLARINAENYAKYIMEFAKD